MVYLLSLSFVMKSDIMGLLIMISFLLIAGRSNGRLITSNSPLIPTDNPSSFDPNVNSIGLHTAGAHVEKGAMECDQERSAPSGKLLSRLSPSVRKTKKIELSASKNAKGIFNLLPDGPVSPSLNSIVTKQRVRTSTHRPDVTDMQMIQPKSLTVNVDARKSYHSNEDDPMQQKRATSASCVPVQAQEEVDIDGSQLWRCYLVIGILY